MATTCGRDFVFERTREGRPLKFLTVVDEFTRQCLVIEVARKQSSRDVSADAGRADVEARHPETHQIG